jgi:NUMOD4 motif/HNH endonuclease
MIQINVAEATEEWRAVVGYEGRYEVSSFGRVRSLIGANDVLRIHIKLQRMTGGKRGKYLRVNLYKNGTHLTMSVHKLVAEAFIGPCPPGWTVNHKDTIKTHNFSTNLEYLTGIDNTAHSVANRLHAYGERNGRCKLQEEDIPIIRQRVKNGESCYRVAKDYPVSETVIVRIVDRRLWKHVA